MDSSNAGVVGILDLRKVQLTSDDKQELPIITMPGSNVFIKPVHLTNLQTHDRTQQAGDICVSVKTFMSKKLSFGCVGQYGYFIPKENEVNKGYVPKAYTMTLILQDNRKPSAKFTGTLQMWRSDLLARLIVCRRSQQTDHKKYRKDDAFSRRFFSRVLRFHCPGNERSSQSDAGNVNISVYIELISLYVTDLYRRGYFPPTAQRSHTHFRLPSTDTIALSQHREDLLDSVMRLLSFLYIANNSYLYPVLARAGFYHVDGVVTCLECDCSYSLSDFKGGDQSDIDKHHKIGCRHRNVRKEDCELPPPRQHSSNTMSSLPPVGASRYHSGNAIAKRRNEEGSFQNEGTANLQPAHLRPPVNHIKSTRLPQPTRELNCDMKTPQERKDSFQHLKPPLHVWKSLVKHGFYYDGDEIRCCSCKILYDKSYKENPALVHTQKNSTCEYFSFL